MMKMNNKKFPSSDIVRELKYHRIALTMYRPHPYYELIVSPHLAEIERIEGILKKRLELLNNAHKKGDYEGFVDIEGEILFIQDVLSESDQ